MGLDKRGVLRSRCTVCNCQDYERPGGDDGHDCATCGCKPSKHVPGASQPKEDIHQSLETAGASQSEPDEHAHASETMEHVYVTETTKNEHASEPTRYELSNDEITDDINTDKDDEYQDSEGVSDKEDMFRQALAMSMKCEGDLSPVIISTSSGSADVTQSSASSEFPLDVSSMTEEDQLANAMQMSTQESQSNEDTVNVNEDSTSSGKENLAKRKLKLSEDLWLAADGGDVDAVQALLKKGAHVNIQGNGGWTPVYAAVLHEHLPVVRVLIQAGADVDIATTEKGSTPLYTATAANNLQLVRELLQAGADINKAETTLGDTPLILACVDGYTDVAVCLLSNGADKEKATNKDFTPLHAACLYGHRMSAEALLDCDCNLTPITNKGLTPLHLAALDGRLELGKLLLERGHPLMAVTLSRAQETPLDIAQQFGQHEFANMLLKRPEYKALNLTYTKTGQVGARQQYQITVKKLMDAIISDTETALIYIRNGSCDVHCQDSRGLTALHHSAARGDLMTVKALVDFGCHPSPISLAGRTPTDLAIENEHSNVKEFLTQKSQQSKIMDWGSCSRSFDDILLTINNAGMRKKENLSDIETQSNMFEAIKKILSLLRQGTPLAPPGSIPTELISMVITSHYNHSCIILELFLALGAPLLKTTGRQSILEMAWLATTTTTKEAAVITRVLEMNLVYELQQVANRDSTDSSLIQITKNLLTQLGADSCLKEALKGLLPDHDKQLRDSPIGKIYAPSGYTTLLYLIGEQLYPLKERELDQLSDKYDNIKPWRAVVQVGNKCIGDRQYNHASHLLVRACELGLTHMTWWIWRSRVNMSIPAKDGQSPLMAAVANQHWGTARDLVRCMGANPFIRTATGKVPLQLMPQWLKQEMLQQMVMNEYRSLENHAITAKNPEKKIKMRKLSLLLGCLYVAKIDGKPEKNSVWKALYMMSVNVLTEGPDVDKQRTLAQKNTSNGNVEQNKGDDRLDWLKKLTEEMTGEVKSKDKDKDEDREVANLPELVSCLKGIVNSNFILEKANFIEDTHDEEIVEQIQDMINEALEICCERSFPLFLHLLIDYVGVDPNAIMDNNMLNTKPVHIAAANGKSGTLVYLHYTYNVPLDHVDKNKNNPAHLAFLHGKTDTGKLLIHMKPDLSDMKNSSGKTPLHLKDAYEKRIREVEELLTHKEYGPKAKELINQMYEQNDELSLAKKNMELLYLRKESRGMSFRALAMELIVDFEIKEAKVISQRVVELVNKLINSVGQRNPLFKGIPIPLGSSSDNLRLRAPDEFDFNIILALKGIILSVKDLSDQEKIDRGYNKGLTLTSESVELQPFLIEGNKLDEFKLLGAFYSYVKVEIGSVIDHGTDENLTIIEVNKTGVGVSLTMAWMGKEYPLLHIDVDLVPVIKLPYPAEIPHPPLIKRWIEEDKGSPHEMVLGGRKWTFPLQDVISAYISGDGRGLWRFSTGIVENYCMLKMSEKQREVYIITKYIISAFKPEGWHNRDMKDRYRFYSNRYFNLPTPTGFILKTAFFNELENVQDESVWQDEWYLQRIRSVFLRMTKVNDYQKRLLQNMITDTNITVVKETEDDFLDVGLLPSYFASDIQWKSRGFMAHTIYQLLERSVVMEFIN